MQNLKNENLQKDIILVNLRLWEYQNRIQHVHKPLHAKYELRSCLERRVMTILRQKALKKNIIMPKASKIVYNHLNSFKNHI